MGDIRTADIAVMAAIPMMLTYRVPEGMQVPVGSRVVVPVRKTAKVGIAVSVKEEQDDRPGLRSIERVLDGKPLIPRELLDLLLWASRYYHTGAGATLALAFPPYLRRARMTSALRETRIFRTGTGRGVVGKKQHEILLAVPEQGMSPESFRELFPGCSSSLKSLIKRGFLEQKQASPSGSIVSVPEPSIRHTAEQKAAIRMITDALGAGCFRSFLLYGITGSGKTEVYLACAVKALAMGRSVLYLVPEIALTPQTISMIKNRIPLDVAVFHSGLPPAARAREFLKTARSATSFVLGTRSAVFSPLANLGLIIVDEEHDHSYKQEDGIPYNARDLSLLRAKNNRAVVILGSATPSMDVYIRASGKDHSLITMSKRTGGAGLPAIDVIDMRGVKSPVSDQLSRAIQDTLDKSEQTLLFINRRGYAPAMICPACGLTLKCVRCDRSLTYHRGKGSGVCHYCGYSMALPEICPKCGCIDMKPLGIGTENIVQRIQALFPRARVLKMDSDEITTSNKLTKALGAIRDRQADIIVGTQMIAKGHDFPFLTLVGVMHAEQLMFMPDFRAGERTFQQVVQVAGRAGRRTADTRVLVQTLIPDHPLIQAIAGYDYTGMIRAETEVRKASGFPPFTFMARCIFSSADNSLLTRTVNETVRRLKPRDVNLLGPAPAPISLLRGSHRWHIILTSNSRDRLHAALDRLELMQLPSGIRLRIDVDPYTML